MDKYEVLDTVLLNKLALTIVVLMVMLAVTTMTGAPTTWTPPDPM